LGGVFVGEKQIKPATAGSEKRGKRVRDSTEVGRGKSFDPSIKKKKKHPRGKSKNRSSKKNTGASNTRN